MHRKIGTALVLAALAAAPAAAQSLVEMGAAMGVQGTLAQGSASTMAGTLNTVRQKVGDAAAMHNGQIADQAQVAWGGKSLGTSRWAKNGKNGTSDRGWADGSTWGKTNGTPGAGWALAKAQNDKSWANGPWGSR